MNCAIILHLVGASTGFSSPPSSCFQPFNIFIDKFTSFLNRLHKPCMNLFLLETLTSTLMTDSTYNLFFHRFHSALTSQHVTPTHTHGHILAFVITANSSSLSPVLSYSADTTSDHHPISSIHNILPNLPPTPSTFVRHPSLSPISLLISCPLHL